MARAPVSPERGPLSPKDVARLAGFDAAEFEQETEVKFVASRVPPWVYVVSGFVVLLLAFWLFLRSVEQQQSLLRTSIPRQVVGLWTSDHPNYSDRFFVITNAIIILGVGDRNMEVYMVENVVSADTAFYTVKYVKHPGGIPLDFSFFWERQSDGGRIRFKNQRNVVWTKYSERTWTNPEEIESRESD